MTNLKFLYRIICFFNLINLLFFKHTFQLQYIDNIGFMGFCIRSNCQSRKNLNNRHRNGSNVIYMSKIILQFLFFLRTQCVDTFHEFLQQSRQDINSKHRRNLKYMYSTATKIRIIFIIQNMYIINKTDNSFQNT